MVDTKIILGIGAFIAAYIVFRIFFSYLSRKESEYEKQLKTILTSDKYKVKGRHD